MDGLLRLSFQFRQLLLHVSFEIPIWPVWCDIQEILHVLGEWGGKFNGKMAVTKSWALFASSSATICSANPFTLASRVSSISTLLWCLRNVRVSGSKFRLINTGSLASPLDGDTDHIWFPAKAWGYTYLVTSTSSPARFLRKASKRSFRASEAAASDIARSSETTEGRGESGETRQLNSRTADALSDRRDSPATSASQNLNVELG